MMVHTTFLNGSMLLAASLCVGLPGDIVHAQDERTEDVKLVAPDAEESDEFGGAVAVFGDTLVCGAPDDDDNDTNSGSAYVYRLVNDQWTFDTKLLPSGGGAFLQTGHAIAADGFVDTVIALSSPAFGDRIGRVHIFRRDEQNWIEEATISASDGVVDNWFGHAVAVSGDVVVAGATNDELLGEDTGAAYVFRYDGSTWVEEAILRLTDAEEFDRFGWSVAAHGNTVVIGCMKDNDRGSNSGAAYVYEYNGSRWQQVQRLLASDGRTGDFFGSAVAMDDSRILVGARGDLNGTRPGAAYTFVHDGVEWIQESRLTALDSEPGDWFGNSVSIWENRAVVGAELRDNNNAIDSGQAYPFRDDGNGWEHVSDLVPSVRSGHLFFGIGVSVSGGVVAVGGPRDDSQATDAGAVYLYDDGPIADCLTLQIENLVAGDFATARISGGVPGERCALFYGLEDGRSEGDSGMWCVDLQFYVPPLRVSDHIVFTATFDQNGEIAQPISVPLAARGFDVRFQTALRNTCPDVCMSNVWQGVVQ